MTRSQLPLQPPNSLILANQPYAILILVLFSIDQLLKLYVAHFVALHEEISLGVFSLSFSITHLYNYQLNNIPASGIILALLACFLNHPRIHEAFGEDTVVMNTSFACMIGGMLGNLADMIFHAKVLDFYMIPVNPPMYYLVANFADFAIVSAYFFSCMGLYSVLKKETIYYMASRKTKRVAAI